MHLTNRPLSHWRRPSAAATPRFLLAVGLTALAAAPVFAASAYAEQAPAPVVHIGPATDDVDVNPAGTVQLVVPNGGTIQDVDVAVALTGGVGYAREIELSLSHLGVTVVLHQAVENPANPPYVGGAIDAVFDDEAIATIGQPPMPRTGTADIFIPVLGSVIPAEALSAFDGMDAAGVWTLSMRDPGIWQNDGEDLASWSITLEVAPETCSQVLAYAPMHQTNRVQVIDTTTNTVIASIPVGVTPHGLTPSPDQTRLYVVNRNSNSMSVIDTATHTVIGTVYDLFTPQGGVVVHPSGSPVYVTMASVDYRSVAVVDPVSLSVTATIPIGRNPFGLVILPDGSRLYAANCQSNDVSVIDTATETVVATIPMGPDLGSGAGAFCVAVTPSGDHVYVTNRFQNEVAVIATATNTVTAVVPGMSDPIGVAVDPAGARVYVANSGANSIAVIDTATNVVIQTIATDFAPGFVEVDPHRSIVHVLGGNSYQSFSTVTGAMLARVEPGDYWDGVLAIGKFLACAPSDSPPVADAGTDFSVNEGTLAVALDGSSSSDPDNDPLTFAWSQVAGPGVTLNDVSIANPTFDAPLVALGGETLTFQLSVTGNGVTATDSVNVTVVNLNHPPVADAGADQALAEGSPVTLTGQDSFDIDLDELSYSWVQVSGPAVTLQAATTANPTFDAPYFGSGGAPGVVAELEFELTVDDGYPAEVPAPGYTFANVRDTVTISVLNVNSDPVADAGTAQTSNENVVVTLCGAQSSDPDDDALTYSWVQTGGPAVTLAGATTVAPSFTTPFVGAGGADLTFELTVDDGNGGQGGDTVVVHVQNVNDPPNADAARPSQDVLWPPNHKLVPIRILGVTDPNDNATITIDLVTQDEPTAGTGSGDTPVDAIICADGTVLLRAERQGNGDGRVYRIHFTASDLEGSRSGVVTVTVPQDKRSTAVDSGSTFDSTL